MKHFTSLLACALVGVNAFAGLASITLPHVWDQNIPREIRTFLLGSQIYQDSATSRLFYIPELTTSSSQEVGLTVDENVVYAQALAQEGARIMRGSPIFDEVEYVESVIDEILGKIASFSASRDNAAELARLRGQLGEWQRVYDDLTDILLSSNDEIAPGTRLIALQKVYQASRMLGLNPPPHNSDDFAQNWHSYYARVLDKTVAVLTLPVTYDQGLQKNAMNFYQQLNRVAVSPAPIANITAKMAMESLEQFFGDISYSNSQIKIALKKNGLKAFTTRGDSSPFLLPIEMVADLHIDLPDIELNLMCSLDREVRTADITDSRYVLAGSRTAYETHSYIEHSFRQTFVRNLSSFGSCTFEASGFTDPSVVESFLINNLPDLSQFVGQRIINFSQTIPRAQDTNMRIPGFLCLRVINHRLTTC